MLMLAMKSAGPKMIVSIRGLANAMSLTLIRPCAVSICASMPIRPTSRPLAFSIWVSSMSSALTCAASCDLRQHDAVELGAGAADDLEHVAGRSTPSSSR